MDQNKRPENMERSTTPQLAEAFIAQQIEAVRAQVGDRKVLLALSGGGVETHSQILEGVRPDTTIDVATIDTSKEMTPAEVYAQNVASTVGLTTSITTNFFGFVPTSAAAGSGGLRSRRTTSTVRHRPTWARGTSSMTAIPLPPLSRRQPHRAARTAPSSAPAPRAGCRRAHLGHSAP